MQFKHLIEFQNININLFVLHSTQKRNDREEIRRRLAMGAEDDYLTKLSTAKPGRKPSLQSRLQEGLLIVGVILNCRLF